MSILSGLAHLERCMFPKDFEKELKSLGMDKFDAKEFAKMVEKDKGIVEIYQYAQSCKEPYATNLTKIIDKYVDNWMQEFKHLTK